MRFRFSRRVPALLLALALLCSLAVPASADSPTLTMNPSSLTLRANQIRTLTIEVSGDTEDTFPNVSTSKIIWTTSDPSRVSLPGDGDAYTVTPDEDGNLDLTCDISTLRSSDTPVTITANCYEENGNKRVASVTCVVTIQAAGITLDRASALMNVGDYLDLNATVQGGGRPDRWDIECAPAGCATLEPVPNGTRNSQRVFARAVGSATVIASTSDGDTALCSIIITAPDTTRVSGVFIENAAGQTIDPEGTFTLDATVTPGTALDKSVYWSSSDNSVARVSSSGVITGVRPGNATITVTTSDGGFKDEYEIQVSGIRLEKSSISLLVNKSETLAYECFGAASTITPTWSATNPSIAAPASQYVGRITGHYPGETEITATAGKYTATCTVKVSEDVAQVITAELNSSGTLKFSDLLSDLDSRSRDKADAALASLYSMEVPTSQGHLYYRYVSPASPGHGVGGSERYYVHSTSKENDLADVTFVPLPGFSGTAEIEYTGTGTNGLTFSGIIQVDVVSSGDLTYSTGMNQEVSFRSDDFTAMCRERNGHALSYVTFDPPAASRGTLYYNYSPKLYSQKVESGTRYYAGSTPSLDSVTFLPADGFTGTVDVGYRYTDTSGATASGTIHIHVGSLGENSGNTVEYSIGVDQRLDLEPRDFNRVSRYITSTDLRSIRFESLPVSGVGRLYVDYTSSSSKQVSTSTRYYYSSSPRISSISFLPAGGYSGTVTIPFTGTTTSGGTFSSSLVIKIGEGSGTVHYTTAANQAVTFQTSDFNSACRQNNGTTLNRVRFDLPASSSGTLYANYVSPSNPGSRVAASAYYYRTGTPPLSSVTFVPANGYNGTVSIPFEGYDDSGVRFSGTVTITVGSARDERVVTYSTTTGGVVRFGAADFNDACRAITGSTLNYVRFDLPASRNGTLYYRYDSARKTGTSVSSSTGYYRSSGNRLLNDVYYVAGSNTGVIVLSYTGYASGGDSFSGRVEITVSAPVSSAVRYSGSSTPISFRAADFQSACQAALGNSLDFIQFDGIPVAGHLYLNYAGPNSTGTAVSIGTRYYAGGSPSIGQITYVPKAEYQGLVTFSYTAYDAQGSSYHNTVEISLSNSNCHSSFSDVASGWDWAKPSIEYLRQSGIVNGYGDGTFRPGRQISRGEFTLMVCRAFGFSTAGGNSGFPDVPSTSSYAGAVATARDLGIVQGNNGLFQPTRPITRQSAMTMICRAMTAAGRPAPSASTSLLSAYRDGSQVSSYARTSVASLVQMGAVQGNSDMRLMPTSAISRAQMAVILHRVLAR